MLHFLHVIMMDTMNGGHVLPYQQLYLYHTQSSQQMSLKVSIDATKIHFNQQNETIVEKALFWWGLFFPNPFHF